MYTLVMTEIATFIFIVSKMTDFSLTISTHLRRKCKYQLSNTANNTYFTRIQNAILIFIQFKLLFQQLYNYRSMVTLLATRSLNLKQKFWRNKTFEESRLWSETHEIKMPQKHFRETFKSNSKIFQFFACLHVICLSSLVLNKPKPCIYFELIFFIETCLKLLQIYTSKIFFYITTVKLKWHEKSFLGWQQT